MTRRYNEEDLRGLTRPQLIKLIETQPDDIPKPFNRSKLLKSHLQAMLLASDSPFKTTDPLLSSKDSELDVQTIPDSTSQADASTSVTSQADDTTHNDFSCLNSSEHVDRPEAGETGALNRVSTAAEASEMDDVSDIHGSVELRLYIQDGRLPLGSIGEKTTKKIVVTGTLVEARQIQIPLQEVIREMQAGFGALTGTNPVKVGVRNDEHPEYTEFFVVSEPSMLHTIATSPTLHLIHVPDGEEPVLSLRVDYASYSSANNTATVSDQVHASSASISSSDPRNQIIEWLHSKAKARQGYHDFSSTRHHLRQNKDIVSSWSFAAEFSNHYFKQMHPYPIGNKKILKSDIYKALQVKETWLGQAEEAVRILSIFGEEGSHPASEVVDRVSETTNPPQGSVRLLKFLKDWNSNHCPDM